MSISISKAYKLRSLYHPFALEIVFLYILVDESAMGFRFSIRSYGYAFCSPIKGIAVSGSVGDMMLREKVS
jgi:hypothetical protein